METYLHSYSDISSHNNSIYLGIDDNHLSYHYLILFI